jgi:hypothetical protein
MNFSKATVVTFGKSKRNTGNNYGNFTPGPGAYKIAEKRSTSGVRYLFI